MIPDHTQTEFAPPANAGSSAYAPCEQCGSPLDARQRYCLSCGTRHKHAADPAARFLAGASRRQKPAASAGRRPQGGPVSVLTLGAVLLIPLALGLGVFLGHSSSGPDAKLISALRSGSGTRGAGASGSAASGTAVASSTGSSSGTASPRLVVGSWTRSSGYTIQLGSLSSGTSSAAAASAEQADRSKGASAVGILNTSAFHITPAPRAQYIIYSGSYATSAAATRALASLKKKFSGARVIHVVTPTAASNTKVVSRTSYGAAHQVVGYKPSRANLAQGAQVANQDAHSRGKTASGAGLPDVVSVP